MIEHFGAPDGGFFDTSDDHETLIVRPRELQDNAVPSGNGMAALVLLRLAGLAVEPRYLELAQTALGPMQPLLARHPLGFGQWLIALDYALAHPREITIVGDAEATDTRAMLDVILEEMLSDQETQAEAVQHGELEVFEAELRGYDRHFQLRRLVFPS